MPITAFKSNIILKTVLSLESWGKVLQIHSTTARFPLSFVILVHINDCQVKRFDESLQKTVFMLNSRHALHNAVQLQWMLDGVGVVGGTYWEFSICFGINLKSINQCLNWPALSILQNIKVRRYVDHKT